MPNYKVLQQITVGEETYFPGDVVAETDDGRDWAGMMRLKLVEPTGERQKVLTSEEKSDTVTRKAEVKKAGVWWQVFDENGEKIGSTRDEYEANKIKSDYESGV